MEIDHIARGSYSQWIGNHLKLKNDSTIDAVFNIVTLETGQTDLVFPVVTLEDYFLETRKRHT